MAKATKKQPNRSTVEETAPLQDNTMRLAEYEALKKRYEDFRAKLIEDRLIADLDIPAIPPEPAMPEGAIWVKTTPINGLMLQRMTEYFAYIQNLGLVNADDNILDPANAMKLFSNKEAKGMLDTLLLGMLDIESYMRLLNILFSQLTPATDPNKPSG